MTMILYRWYLSICQYTMISFATLLAISLFSLRHGAIGLTCPPNYRPNGSTRCLYVVNNQTATASSAPCGSNFLVDVQDQTQYTNLKLYLQVQGTPSSTYWTRYSFDASSALTPFSNILSNSSNFNGTSSGGNQCVAIQQQGLFVVTSCTTNLPFICVSDTQALTTPTAVLRATPTPPTVGSAVTLTCSYSNSSSVSFQRNDVTINTTSVSLMDSTSQLTLTLASIQAGRYDCVASNPLGAVKSTAIVVAASSGNTTDIGSITVMFNGTITNTHQTKPLGTTFTLSCSSSYSSGLLWTWFRNGVPLPSSSSSSSSSSSTLNVSDFNTYDTSGFYQCRALDPASNSSAMGQLLILATAGIPAPVSTLLVGAWSQTQLQVLWTSPLSPNTDPALLRYQFLYGVGSPGLVYPSDGSYLQPSLSVLMNRTLAGLSVGTVYTVAILSCSEVGCDTSHLMPTTAMTFGLAPNTSVQGVVLTYSALKEEIVVAWAPLATHPPEGEVAFYEVQYGLSNTSLNTFRAHPPTSSVVLDGVPEDDFQARVRAAVTVLVSPETYAYSQWSVWTKVPPPDTPTTPTTPTVHTSSTEGQRDASHPAALVIAPSVVVTFVIVMCVGVGVASCLLWHYCKRSSWRWKEMKEMKEMKEKEMKEMKGHVRDDAKNDPAKDSKNGDEVNLTVTTSEI